MADAVATVSGGAALEAKLKELSSRVPDVRTLRVGFLEGATYPDGTSVAMVAAMQNFGSRSIPERPFFTEVVNKGAESWGLALANILEGNGYDGDAALRLMGEHIAGEIREAVIALDAPALSPITLMLRKMRSEDQSLEVTGATVGEAARRVAAGESYGGVSTKPLVDSGHMLNSIGYEVNEE